MIDNRKMCQSEFIRQFNDRNREEFNPKLFERDNLEIINKVSDVILSCERDKYFTLKVLSIRSIMDYEEIYDTLRSHEESRKKKGQKDNIYDYINLKDSDIMLLEIKYLVRKNGIERMKIGGKEVNVQNPEQVLQVLIALPRFVNKYYFRLSGNYYSSTVQVVDGSTYNNSTTNNSKCDSVTLKTLFMSVRIFRMFREAIELNSKDEYLYYNRGVSYYNRNKYTNAIADFKQCINVPNCSEDLKDKAINGVELVEGGNALQIK